MKRPPTWSEGEPERRTPTSATLIKHHGSVLEMALRESLRGENPNTTIFIAIGQNKTGYIDPPPAFLQLLCDLPYRLKPASSARMPKPGEMESPNRFRAIEDPRTGKRCWIYWIGEIRWISDKTVSVAAGRTCSPLCGGVVFYDFELRNGQWEFVRMEDSALIF